jgi:hypothetical protein
MISTQAVAESFGIIAVLAMMIFFAAAIWARHDERNGR